MTILPLTILHSNYVQLYMTPNSHIHHNQREEKLRISLGIPIGVTSTTLIPIQNHG